MVSLGCVCGGTFWNIGASLEPNGFSASQRSLFWASLYQETLEIQALFSGLFPSLLSVSSSHLQGFCQGLLEVQGSYNQAISVFMNHLLAPPEGLARSYLGYKYSYGLVLTTLDLQVLVFRNCASYTFNLFYDSTIKPGSAGVKAVRQDKTLPIVEVAAATAIAVRERAVIKLTSESTRQRRSTNTTPQTKKTTLSITHKFTLMFKTGCCAMT